MKEKTFTWKGTVALKLLILHLLFFTCMMAQTAHAQDDPMLYKEVQLQKKSYTFDELTHTIQQQTGITFSYNASKISADRHFRIKTKRMTAIKLLAVIKAKSGIGYKLIHPGFIVYQPPKTAPARHEKLRRKKNLATARNTAQIEPTTTEAEDISTAEKPSSVVAPADSVTQTVVVIGDSAAASGYYFGGGSGGGSGSMGNIEMVMRYPGKNDNIVNPYASLNPPGDEHQQPSSDWNQADIGDFFKKNLLLAAGFSVGETYYFSPALHFGFRFLYADLSYNVGTYPQFRYGLGAEAQINGRWALQVGFNTGKSFSKSYVYTTFDTTFLPPPDSSLPLPPIITEINTPIFVQSQLLCFSLSAVRKVNKNLSISGGLVFNRLSTQYSSGNQPFDLNNIEPPIVGAENRFRTMKPPYELSRSYSPADARLTQLWIGFRIGIHYRLNFSEP